MMQDAVLANMFAGYVGLVGAAIAVTSMRYLTARGAAISIGVLALWLTYAGTLGYFGVVANQHLGVPGIAILLLPVIAFIAVVFVKSSIGLRLALRIPLYVLTGLQVFRVGVELTLHRLWELGSIPKLLTLSGGNIEILIGISAPLVAWLVTRGEKSRRVVFFWNLAGLASLLNVAARAVLTAPGPLHLVHAEVLNTALGTFPFTFIPGFMAPLAVMLHVLTWRAIRTQAATPPQTRT